LPPPGRARRRSGSSARKFSVHKIIALQQVRGSVLATLFQVTERLSNINCNTFAGEHIRDKIAA
jgi:hypothetical protein